MRLNEVKTYVKDANDAIDTDFYKNSVNQRREKTLNRFANEEATPSRAIFGRTDRVADSYARYSGAVLYKNGPTQTATCLHLTAAQLLTATQLGIILDANAKGTGANLNVLGQTLLCVAAYSGTALIDQFFGTLRTSLPQNKFEPFTPEKRAGVTAEDSPYAAQKLFPLAMELLAARKGQDLNWDSTDIRVDQFYIDFARIGLRVEDEGLYQQWFSDLCDAHLDAVSRDLDAEPPVLGFEFDFLPYALWPVDVLAALRVRAELGLPCPAIDHPLMQEPLAQLTQILCEDRAQADQLQPFIDRIKQIEPRLSAL